MNIFVKINFVIPVGVVDMNLIMGLIGIYNVTKPVKEIIIFAKIVVFPNLSLVKNSMFIISIHFGYLALSIIKKLIKSIISLLFVNHVMLNAVNKLHSPSVTSIANSSRFKSGYLPAHSAQLLLPSSST